MPGGDEGIADDDELAFSEFIDGLVAIAAYKEPNPFIQFPTRLDTFILRLFAELRSHWSRKRGNAHDSQSGPAEGARSRGGRRPSACSISWQKTGDNKVSGIGAEPNSPTEVSMSRRFSKATGSVQRYPLNGPLNG